MSNKVAHLIGNGDSYRFYKPAAGLKLTMNVPPIAIANTYATVIVDFKMCRAMDEGSIDLTMYDWVLGARPKKYTEQNSQFYMKYARNIKEFYLHLPPYAKNYTDFNCGHMAVHYTARKLKCNEIHMYGFDSIFDFNLKSTSDLILESNRDAPSTHRLAINWRPIWEGLFKEFKDTQFVLYHTHGQAKVHLPENVDVIIGK